MTQLEKFIALLDEMGVSFSASAESYGDKLTGNTWVFIPTAEPTEILFDKSGNCVSWD